MVLLRDTESWRLRRDLDLDQAAFVEALLMLAPGVVPVLEADPRAFTTLRASLPGLDEGAQLDAVAGILRERPVSVVQEQQGNPAPEGSRSATVVTLHRFLLRHRALPLGWETLRVALLCVRTGSGWACPTGSLSKPRSTTARRHLSPKRLRRGPTIEPFSSTAPSRRS